MVKVSVHQKTTRKRKQGVRIVLVTGATGGLGKAIVDRFVKEGDVVVLNDTAASMKNLDAMAASIAQTHAPPLIAVADVSDTTDVQDMMLKISEHFGRLDVVVNNAGVLSNHLVADLKPEEWDRIYNVNTKGPFLVSKFALPLLEASTFPSIVNIASTGGKRGSPTKAHYGSSKAALISFTRILAMELADKRIRVNAVCPGVVATEMGKNNFSDEASLQKIYDMTALNRLGEPEDIVGTVSFFASKDSAFVTGQTLNVCGGILFD